MRVPKSVQATIEAFERLPGVGPKSAARLTYHLIHAPREESLRLAKAVMDLKDKTILCDICRNISESNPCEICGDKQRDVSVICVLEEPLDVLAVERAGGYNGLYHVLHGSLSPMSNIGPEDLHIKSLLIRLGDETVKEIILSTNPTMEGEATAMYISKLIKPLGVRVTRIARGLPSGGDIEYADDITLRKAFEGRSDF